MKAGDSIEGGKIQPPGAIVERGVAMKRGKEEWGATDG